MDEHPEKHLQLGVDLEGADEDPVPLTEGADLEAVWADATTIEQYKVDIEALAAASHA